MSARVLETRINAEDLGTSAKAAPGSLRVAQRVGIGAGTNKARRIVIGRELVGAL
jgi:hypothetical protein